MRDENDIEIISILVLVTAATLMRISEASFGT